MFNGGGGTPTSKPRGEAVEILASSVASVLCCGGTKRLSGVAIERLGGSRRVDFSLPNKNLKHAAFTLAETILVIGIIGIVAMLTIPQLIQNTQNKEILLQVII